MKEMKKQSKQSNRSDFSDYEPFLQDGLEKHHWFQEFYYTYGKDIQNEIIPYLGELGDDENWKNIFLHNEIERFKKNPDYWVPIAVEFFIKDNNTRGKIDRIDQLNKQGHCRIVEYKPYPEEFDEEELLFYACLLSRLLPTHNLPAITKITEIGVYYYNSGEFYKAKVIPKTIQLFSEFIECIRTDMLNPISIQTKRDCDFNNTKCLYQEICKRIYIKQQKIIGLSKT